MKIPGTVDQSSKRLTITLLSYAVIFIVLFRSIIFNRTSVIGAESDLFGGIFWWAYASVSNSEYANGLSRTTHLIGAPFGHHFLNPLDLLNLIPRTILYFAAQATNPIFATNLTIMIIVVLNLIAFHKIVMELTGNYLLGIISNFIFFSHDYIVHKIHTHPFIIFNFFLLMSILYLIKFIKNYREQHYYLSIIWSLPMAAADGYQILLFFTLHISILIYFMFARLSTNGIKSVRLIIIQFLFLISTLVFLKVISFFAVLESPLTERTIDDLRGFSFSLKYFLYPSYYSNLFWTEELNLNDENPFSLLPLIVMGVLLFIYSISRVLNNRINDSYFASQKILIFFIILIIMTFFMSANLVFKDISISIPFYFYSYLPYFRVFNRVSLLFIYSFITLLSISLFMFSPARSRAIKFLFLPTSIVVFVAQNLFFLNAVPITNLGRSDSVYQFLHDNTPNESIVYELRNVDASTGFIGWQFIHNRRLANEGPMLNSKFVLGPYDPGFSCVMRANSVDYVVIPKNIISDKPDFEPLGSKLVDVGASNLLYEILPGSKANFVSLFENGFHPAELKSHTGYWTSDIKSTINFEAIGKEALSKSSISFQVSSLMDNVVTFVQDNKVIAKYNVGITPRSIDMNLDLGAPLVIQGAEIYQITNVLQSTDKREVGLFFTYPDFKDC